MSYFSNWIESMGGCLPLKISASVTTRSNHPSLSSLAINKDIKSYFTLAHHLVFTAETDVPIEDETFLLLSYMRTCFIKKPSGGREVNERYE
jgi:hypothetical protein